MATKTKKVLELEQTLRDIDEELKLLQGDANYVYKAPAGFKMNELDGNTVNIQTCLDIESLLKFLGLMLEAQRRYNMAMDYLKLKEAPVAKWYSTPISAWISDLKFRINMVTNGSRIHELNARRAELTEFLTKDQRLNTALAKARSTLNTQKQLS